MTSQPILFVQGGGDIRAPDGSGVLARWLERSLGPDYELVAPEMPDAETDPRYRPWRNRIEQELESLGDGVRIVGHSLGGSVVLKYLSEDRPPVEIAGLFLVAVPWWGPEGWAWDEFAVPDDFGGQLADVRTFLYQSREDPEVPFTHLQMHADRLPHATTRPIDGAEHSFVNGLPALLDDILSAS